MIYAITPYNIKNISRLFLISKEPDIFFAQKSHFFCRGIGGKATFACHISKRVKLKINVEDRTDY
jgi:hypothetical protein